MKKEKLSSDNTSSSKSQALYASKRLIQLRSAFISVYRRQGKNDTLGVELFDRLSNNLRLLEHLHIVSRAVLTQQSGAVQELRRRLLSLIALYPEMAGSRTVLLDRAGLPSSSSRLALTSPKVSGTRHGIRRMSNEQRGIMEPCGILSNTKLATIYVAILAAYAAQQGELTQPVEQELAQMLDVVAALSLGHGHLENLSGVLREGGLDGLQERLDWAEASGHPFLSPEGGGKYQPYPPHNPVPDDPTFPTSGGRHGLIRGNEYPPELGGCEFEREFCEGLLIEVINRGTEAMPLSGVRPYDLTHNIEYIELQGACAGGVMVIHGHSFGDAQPDNVELIANVDGQCIKILVKPDKWSNTRIEVLTPSNMLSGPVGFRDSLAMTIAVSSYNQWVGQINHDMGQIAVASRCLGTPLDVPQLPPLKPSSCPPDIGVNYVEVGLPIIHSFTISTLDEGGAQIPAEPEDELTLHWDVENADEIRLRRLGNDGPTLNEVFTDQARGSSLSLGLAGHNGPEMFRYRLAASNACGQVTADVRVVASKRPELSIERIEVTQGIQTLSNDLPLVEYKPTVVRVYIGHGLNGFAGDEVPDVTGRIRLQRAGEPWTPWYPPINRAPPRSPEPPLPDIGAFITVPASINRSQTDDTLNFIIPTGLCEGTINLEIEVEVREFGAAPGNNGFDETVSRVFEDFTFHPRRRLKIKYIPVTVDPAPPPGSGIVTPTSTTGISGGLSNPPTDDQCRDFIQESLKFIPAIAEYIQLVTFSAPSTSTWPGNLDYTYWTETTMNSLYAQRMPIELPEEIDAYWAVLVPVANVPYARANWPPRLFGGEYITPMGRSNDFLTQEAEATAAHELAHCLGQSHINLCGFPFPPGDNPDDWPNRGEVIDVPFDISRNTTVTGSPVTDLMTYCAITWTSPQRWQQLFDIIGE